MSDRAGADVAKTQRFPLQRDIGGRELMDLEIPCSLQLSYGGMHPYPRFEGGADAVTGTAEVLGNGKPSTHPHAKIIPA
jgi:hypothetical protein